MAIHIDNAEDDGLIGQINTTPLVDVMLVLLIIFLITIPVVTTSVPVDLPKQSNQVRQAKSDNVIISVSKLGQIYLFDSLVHNEQELIDRVLPFVQKNPQPVFEVRGDGQTRFQEVGRVIYALQRGGVAKLGFILEPASQ
jgi:biopolymer transport protein ExbD